MKHRSAHYWNWFIFFGLIAGAIAYVSAGGKFLLSTESEPLWLFISGLLGVIVTANWLNKGKFARPYDVIVGIIFTLVGAIGILLAFKVHALGNLNTTYVNPSSILGLSLGVLASLVHAVLGLTSLNHGIKPE
jgi:hypothetical protein